MSVASLVIKNPSSSNDFPVSLPATHRVLDLKQHIQKEYPENPQVDRQKLIFFGRLLQDGDLLADTFKDLSIPHTVHLIISRPQAPHNQPTQPQHPQQQPQHPVNIHQQRVEQMRQQAARNLQPQMQQQQPDAPQPPQEQGGGNQALLIKLTILVFILAQGGGTLRAVFLLAGAFVLYLYLTGRFRIQLYQYNPRHANPAPDNGDGMEEEPQQPVNRGITGEISDIVIPFISSLAPTWNPYEIDVPVARQEMPRDDVPPNAQEAPVGF